MHSQPPTSASNNVSCLSSDKNPSLKHNHKFMQSTFAFSLSTVVVMAIAGCNTSHEQAVDDTSNEAILVSKQQVEVAETVANSADVAVVGSARMVSMPSPIPPPPTSRTNSENYAEIERNAVHRTLDDAIATFSIDTDTGSYANVRRFINQGQLPPKEAVRVEELINYFNYDFANAKRLYDKTNVPAPFVVDTQVVASPWQTSPVNENRIVKIGIKAVDAISEMANQNTLPPANLVFLVDVSGSMEDVNKLKLAKSSLRILTKQLREQDTITLITYAGNTEVVLPATKGSDTRKILAAIDKLDAGGSTNGEAAIKLAYEQAQDNFKKKGINRILMLTDGDFNVGVSNVDDMLEIIERGRDTGISLSTFGFGQGNYNNHMMEQVADTGNGNYSYIDSLSEAKKVLIDEMSSTFNTIAKDVKVQVEFNPNAVSEWRLVGYENRVLADEDFNNDKVDAGELGAGKSVVALFEVTPVGQQGWLGEKRYGNTSVDADKADELGYLKIRYKDPKGNTSKLLTQPIMMTTVQPSADTQFALAVAGYGQRLTGSKYVGDYGYGDITKLAKTSLQANPQVSDSEARHEFVKLVELAGAMDE